MHAAAPCPCLPALVYEPMARISSTQRGDEIGGLANPIESTLAIPMRGMLGGEGGEGGGAMPEAPSELLGADGAESEISDEDRPAAPRTNDDSDSQFCLARDWLDFPQPGWAASPNRGVHGSEGAEAGLARWHWAWPRDGPTLRASRVLGDADSSLTVPFELEREGGRALGGRPAGGSDLDASLRRVLSDRSAGRVQQSTAVNARTDAELADHIAKIAGWVPPASTHGPAILAAAQDAANGQKGVQDVVEYNSADEYEEPPTSKPRVHSPIRLHDQVPASLNSDWLGSSVRLQTEAGASSPAFHTDGLTLDYERELEARYGLIVRRVQGDGSCLFRCIALCVYAEEARHDLVSTILHAELTLHGWPDRRALAYCELSYAPPA